LTYVGYQGNVVMEPGSNIRRNFSGRPGTRVSACHDRR